MSLSHGASKLHLRAYTASSHMPIASTSKLVLCQRVATARQFSSRPEPRTPQHKQEDGGSDLLNLLDRARDARDPSPSSSQSPSQGGWWDQILSDMDTDATDSFQNATPAKRKQLVTTRAPANTKLKMTVREQRAADDMFNQIFSSMSDAMPAPFEEAQPSRTGLSALMGALSRSRRVARPGEDPELEMELDKMNEAIDNALSDHELLQWAEREVFAQSVQLATAADALIEGSAKDASEAPLQAATYPHAIAKLMRTFRDKYRDPHLALAVFAHARSLSTYSYVMGCTTGPYNELLQTRWECFRDLRGVYEAIQEMATNKVRRDDRTRALWENIRREVGSSATPNDGLFDILGRIDQMVGKDPPRRERFIRGETLDQRFGREKRISRHKRYGNDRNAWRNPGVLESREEEGLGFGEWERPLPDAETV